MTPLEIWDLLIGNGILSDQVGARGFGKTLHKALAELHAGRGRTRSGGAVPASCRGFNAAVLTGGGATDEVLSAGLSPAPFDTVAGEADPFVGERAGYHLLGGTGFSGAVVDVGQSQIKISLANRRFTYPRDFDRLPARSQEPGMTDRGIVDSQRDGLQCFIADSLRNACQTTGFNPPALVVALPCEIDDHAVPGSSSYLGTAGNADLVPQALDLAGLVGCKTMLLNDAELAALSVAVSPGKPVGERVLVVTIGFAVGGALLETLAWQK